MKFNSQICTTKEQSERLLALGLKSETADMCINPSREFVYPFSYSEVLTLYDNYGIGKLMEADSLLPSWSLHRLIEMMPITVPDKSGVTHFFTVDGASDISYYFFGEEEWEIWKSWSQKELYDNVIDCIEWLIKEGHFNKEYLE